MKALIVYATYSSGTQSASEVIDETLQELGYEVTCKRLPDASPNDFDDHHLVVLGSPSWMIDNQDGQPHHFFLDFMKNTEGKEFKDTLFAIYGLGDTTYAHFCGAVDHLEKFVGDMKGILLQPTLRIDGYYFDQERNNYSIRQWVHTLIKNLPPFEGRPSHL